jgi:hypothetical protein
LGKLTGAILQSKTRMKADLKKFCFHFIRYGSIVWPSPSAPAVLSCLAVLDAFDWPSCFFLFISEESCKAKKSSKNRKNTFSNAQNAGPEDVCPPDGQVPLEKCGDRQ